MTRLGWTVDVSDLPAPELCAARLDGELFDLDRGYYPVDLPESPMHRAATLLAAAGCHLIAERLSAAWIHGATSSPPHRHEFCVDHRRRVYRPCTGGLLAREVVLTDADSMIVGGMRVTTPLRTVLDLARVSEQFDGHIRAVTATLISDHRITWEDCERPLNCNRHLPNRHRALARIRTVV